MMQSKRSTIPYKYKEDVRVDDSKAEASINKIEINVDRLLNFVTYVGRYTENGVRTSENISQANDTTAVCPTGNNKIYNEGQSNSIT